MSVLRQIIKDLRPFRKTIAEILVLSIIAAILGLVGPLVYKILTDSIVDVSEGKATLAEISGTIIIALIAWAGAELLYYIFDFIYHKKINNVSNFYSRNLLMKSFSHIQNLSLRFHIQSKSGGIMRKIDSAADFAWQIITALLSDILAPLISFVAIAIVIFFQSWKLAIVAVVTIPVYILVTYYITKKISSQQEKVNKLWEKGYGQAYDSMTNIEAVKAYSGEDYEIKKVGKIMGDAYSRQMRVASLWISSGFYRNVLFIASQIGVFAFGIYLVANGQITIGTVVMFIGFLAKLHAPLYMLTQTYSRVQQGMTAIGRVYRLMEHKNEVKDLPCAKPMPKIKGDVKFDHISFEYSLDKMVLKDIDFEFEHGKVIAIVGKSGEGKSTLVNLLNRFYDPTSGKILVDGIDIKTIQQQTLRDQIGIVTQENILFNDSILNNIAYGDASHNMENVEYACKVANLKDLIKKLPRGYQTEVGERGVRLSGGEKQRVSIARAVLKNPPILILDEATSHLDSENEKLVQDALWKLIKGRTTFIIAHRLSTIRRADEILVLTDGKIAERGKHNDLVRKDGLYRGLYELQTSGDIEDDEK